MAYYNQGDPQSAKAALEQALRLSPEFPGAKEAKLALGEIGLLLSSGK